MARKNIHWNKDNVNKLMDILITDPYTNQVLNYPEIASEFGVKKGSIKRIVIMLRKRGELPEYDGTKQLDPFLRPYSDHELKRIANAFSCGATVKEVAEFVGRPAGGIRCIRARLSKEGKIEYKCKPWTNEDMQTLIDNQKCDNYFITTNTNELAMMTGHPESSISYKINDLRKAGLIDWPLIAGASEPTLEQRKKYHSIAMEAIFHTREKEYLSKRSEQDCKSLD